MSPAVRRQRASAWSQEPVWGESSDPPFDLRYRQAAYPAYLREQRDESVVVTPSRRRKPFAWAQAMVQLFVVCALAFGCLQMTRAIVSHLYKISVLSAHAGAMQRYYQQTRDESRLLSQKVAVYSSPAGVEELARNNLDMVGPDEILVRLRPRRD